MSVLEIEAHADARVILDRALWTKVARRTQRHLRVFVALTVVVVVMTALRVTEPLLIRWVLDGLATNDRGLVRTAGAVFVAAGLSRAACTFFAGVLAARLGVAVISQLEQDLFARFRTMPAAFFTRTKHGAIVTRMTNDLDNAETLFTAAMPTLVANVSIFVFGSVVMVIVDWRLAVLLAVFGVLVLPARMASRRLRLLVREHLTARTEHVGWLSERLTPGGALLGLVYGDRARDTAEFGERSSSVRSRMIGISTWVALIETITTGGLGLALGAVVVLGGELVLDGHLSIGTLVLFVLFIRIMGEPLAAYSDIRYELITASVSFSRVFDVLDSPVGVKAVARATPRATPARARVEFCDVTFRYPQVRDVTVPSLALQPSIDPPEQLVLDGVSFTIEPGQELAIAGGSGAGKSTIARLLTGLYTPTSGVITIDGIPLDDIAEETRLRMVGYVSQETEFFHSSIRDNLRYASPHSSDADLVSVCRAAEIHDFVYRLPSGYNTLVGEHGLRLSGGQRQRLALARVLLRDPKVVILDEATAHLDVETETMVKREFDRLFSECARLVITHRLTTITNADVIAVLDGGRIAEMGSHRSLVQKKGVYARMWSQRDVSRTRG